MKDEVFDKLIGLTSPQKLDDGSYWMNFSIHRNSEIFDGHFPDQPILPGVVMVEITKRAVESVLGKELQLQEAGNFKFLKMIDPDKLHDAALYFTLIPKENGWRTKAQIKSGDSIYFKADAQYTG